jgi:hypothetical protein
MDAVCGTRGAGDTVGQNLVASGGALMLYFMAYCILKV